MGRNGPVRLVGVSPTELISTAPEIDAIEPVGASRFIKAGMTRRDAIIRSTTEQSATSTPVPRRREEDDWST